MAVPPARELVTDPKALIEAPSPPVAREKQLQELRTCYSGVLATIKPLNAWVYGVPGTGKTLCVRHLLDTDLRHTATLHPYVNCREGFTFLGTIEAILKGLAEPRTPQRSRERQLAQLRRALADRASVIVIDETDVLTQRDLAELLRQLCPLPRTTVICIASSPQALLALPDDVLSRFAPRQIHFPRYTPEELLTILEQTATRALRHNAYTTRVLQSLASHAHGDARAALAFLRHAVQRATEYGATTLRDDHLEAQNRHHGPPRIRDQLRAFSRHHRILYEIIQAKGPIDGPSVERAYVLTCHRHGQTPMSRRTIHKYLTAMCRQRVIARERAPRTPSWMYRSIGDKAGSRTSYGANQFKEDEQSDVIPTA